MRTNLFYIDSDYLANNHNWGTYLSAWSHNAINFWYSTNCQRRHRYPILKELDMRESADLVGTGRTHFVLKESEAQLIFDTQQTEMRLILSCASGSADRIHPILNKSSETQSIRGWYSTDNDAVNIWYSTTVLRAEALAGSTWCSRNWRCDQYLMLNRRRRDWYLILNEALETRSIFDTQRSVGDKYLLDKWNIQTCLRQSWTWFGKDCM